MRKGLVRPGLRLSSGPCLGPAAGDGEAAVVTGASHKVCLCLSPISSLRGVGAGASCHLPPTTGDRIRPVSPPSSSSVLCEGALGLQCPCGHRRPPPHIPTPAAREAGQQRLDLGRGRPLSLPLVALLFVVGGGLALHPAEQLPVHCWGDTDVGTRTDTATRVRPRGQDVTCASGRADRRGRGRGPTVWNRVSAPGSCSP